MQFVNIQSDRAVRSKYKHKRNKSINDWYVVLCPACIPEPVELEFCGIFQLVQLPPADAPAGAEL
jgi:hypothetical protein